MASRGEAGETLMEILVTIVLMGTGILAIITGMFTLINVSDQVHQLSRANLGAHGYAESLKYAGDDFTYQPCAETDQASANTYPSFGDLPTGYSARMTKIRYWNGTVDAARQLVFVDYPSRAACMAAGDKGLQQITIEVTSGPRPHPATESLTIIKRDARCLSAYANADGKPC